jgi:hypothetical protein
LVQRQHPFMLDHAPSEGRIRLCIAAFHVPGSTLQDRRI